MSTTTHIPIKVTGWIVLRDMKIDHVAIISDDWEYGPLPFVSPYGDDKDVVIFRDPDEAERIEADVNVTEPIHDIVRATDLGAAKWVVE